MLISMWIDHMDYVKFIPFFERFDL